MPKPAKTARTRKATPPKGSPGAAADAAPASAGPVSLPAFAQMHNVSRQAAHKWVKLGMPHARRGRSIVIEDVEASARWVRSNVLEYGRGGKADRSRRNDPAAGKAKATKRATTQATTETPADADPTPPVVERTTAGRWVDAGQQPAPPARRSVVDRILTGAEPEDPHEAQRLLIWAKSTTEAIKIAELQGKLISREDAVRAWREAMSTFARELAESRRAIAQEVVRRLGLDSAQIGEIERAVERQHDAAMRKLSAAWTG